MIYFQQGLKTSSMKKARNRENTSDFEYLLQIKPRYIELEKRKKLVKMGAKMAPIGKVEDALYFIAGELKDGVRNDGNLVYLSLIIIDIDDLGNLTEVEVKEKIHTALAEYNYYLYPTFSYTEELPRYRLIIEPDNPIRGKGQKAQVIQEIMEKLGFPYDPSSITYSQCQGLPVMLERDNSWFESRAVINRGAAYPVQKSSPGNTEEPKEKSGEHARISPRSATQMIRHYIEREKDNLLDYTNCLSCIMVLAKAVQEGEITEEMAEKYAVLLAMENQEWADNNVEKLHTEIANPNIKTAYSFEDKFKKIATNTDGEMISTIEAANLLQEVYHFVVIGNDEDARLHVYDAEEGIYASNMNYIYRLIYMIDPRYTEAKVKDVYFKIKMSCAIREREKSKYSFAVGNGVYDAKKHVLEPFTPDRIFTSKIKTNYVKNAPKPKAFDVDNWIAEIACHDEEVITLLFQLINEAVNGNYTRGKFFILQGEGLNSKGTFQQMLINLMGEKNVSTLKMKEIGERFKTYSMIHAVANIGDDVSAEYIPDNSDLMSITTGDSITVEQKGKDSFTAQLSCALIFSMNRVPKMGNKTYGLYRRMVIIPFMADFKGEKEDRSIKDEKIYDKEVLEYVLYKALQLDFQKFIEPQSVKTRLEEYKIHNDTTLEFYKECWEGEVISKFSKVPTSHVFDLYKAFCMENGYKHKSQRTFIIEFQKVLGDDYEKKVAEPSADFIKYIGLSSGEYSKKLRCLCTIS